MTIALLAKMPPVNDILDDDAEPKDYRAPFEGLEGCEPARLPDVRHQRRRLADLPVEALLEELRHRGVTVVLPAGRVR